jgi:hypothetical protein
VLFDVGHGLGGEKQENLQKIRSTIRKGNAHAKLLDDYMATQDSAVKYCKLRRDAGDGWQFERAGSMYPVLYEKCIFDLRTAENEFLKDVLETATW